LIHEKGNFTRNFERKRLAFSTDARSVQSGLLAAADR